MKRVVIFTAGFHARATARHLLRQPDSRVLGFVDNNPVLHGTARLGLPIFAPAALRELDFDLVAVPGRNQAAIQAQLTMELGVARERVWLVRKSEVPMAPDELARRGRALAELLRRTLIVLDARGLRHWVLHSSLLALERGQDPAQFSDVDLGVDASGFDALVPALRAICQVDEFPHPPSVLGGEGASASRLGALGLSVAPDNAHDEPAMVDLHSVAVGSATARWWVEERTLEMPASHFAGREDRVYRGVTLALPRQAPDLLARLYGADWRTPAEVWNGRYAPPLAAAS